MPRSLPRVSVTVLAAALTAAAVICLTPPLCQAIEFIPVREIALGARGPFLRDDTDTMRSVFLCAQMRYWELYRARRANGFHDYHQSEWTLTGLWRQGALDWGFNAVFNSLLLENENVYTASDRMTGGRKVTSGRFLIGYEAEEAFAGSRARALASAGWGRGFEGSFEGRIARSDQAQLGFRVETFASRFEVEQDFRGYRFPFVFSTRSEAVAGEGAISRGAFQLEADGGWEVTSGDGKDGRAGFENLLHFRRVYMGGRIIYRARIAPGNAVLPKRLGSESSLSALSIGVVHRQATGDLGMERSGIRYLTLREAKVFETGARLDWIPLRRASFSVAWNRIRIEHAGDSFFDVWPFNIWDVFEARRYRLGASGGSLDAWSFGTQTLLAPAGLETELDARLVYLDDSFSLRWWERKEILYPFFFEYIPHHETPRVAYRFVLQAKPALSIRAGARTSVRIEGSFILPLGRKELGKERETTDEPAAELQAGTERGRGALFGAISLIYSL